MDTISIASGIRESLLAEAARHAPDECCGLLLGQGSGISRIQPASNVAADPARQFEIDPRTLLDAHRASRRGGEALVGYYHSHPAGPAEPSATDRACAAGDGRVWAIVGGGDVTFWRDDGRGFTPLSIVPAAG